jgi:D-sedoheptulose 7-phosphate isomerase
VGDKALSIAKKHLLASRDVVNAAIADDKFIETITKIAALVTDRLRAGNKALFAGNGGSAADAQHIAGEFVSRLNFDRDPLSGIALTTDSSVLTAIGNDYGYEQVFARQVRGLGRTGDILFAISTSGRSPNILAAVAAAGGVGIHTVAFTRCGDSKLADCCDIVLRAPSMATPLVQQIHIMAAHAICELVEIGLFPRADGR